MCALRPWSVGGLMYFRDLSETHRLDVAYSSDHTRFRTVRLAIRVEPDPNRSSVPQEHHVLMTRRAAATERDRRPPSDPVAAATSTMASGLPQPRTDLVRSHALTSAVLLLTEEGWDSVTQARVATKSGLGRATVYRYWPDRRQMVRDAVLSTNLSVRHQMPASGSDFRRPVAHSVPIEYTRRSWPST
jgi:hypothetical protein